MKKGENVTGEIIAMAFGGKGILKSEGKVVFVEKALLGQTLEVRITKNKKEYAEGKIVKVVKPSPIQQESDFQETPGAPWMLLPIEKQQQIKRELVFDHFKKFAKTDLNLFFDEFIASPQTWFYRNKMEYSFGPTEETSEEIDEKKVWTHSGFGLGSKKRGQFWLVDSLKKPSGMFDTRVEEKLETIRAWCEATGLKVYNTRTHEGFFRHFIVRKSFFEDSFLINIVTSSQELSKFDQYEFEKMIQENIPNVRGILWSLNDGLGDTTQNMKTPRILMGQDHFEDVLMGLSFRVSTHSFFQPNPAAAEHIYRKVLEYLQSDDTKQVYDLYCGTGTIGQVVAKHFPEKNIVGVELISDAVKNAKENAKRNEINNISFACDKVENFLAADDEIGESTMILDPPRVGLHPKAIATLVEHKPQNIIYVSCNPTTMARDICAFKEAGYKIEHFSMVDQFPHTPHIECIGKLSLN